MCKLLQVSAWNGPTAICLRLKAFPAKFLKKMQTKLFFLLTDAKLAVSSQTRMKN